MLEFLRFILLFQFFSLSIAGYVLQDAYQASNFFDMFNFFTGPDPTQGYVKLVDQNTAQNAGLLSQNSSSVKFGVDSQTTNPQDGRMSIRLESKNSYNQGLIVVDLAHMPGSICGTWPAFWTIGPDWPANGEIDIIEGVNSQMSNAMTLHTAAGCSINNAAKQRFSGSIKTNNCDTKASGQGVNVGCGISTTDTTTYGDGFNDVGGGVYATEWTAEAISIYHFARANIPADLNAGNPDPTNWGEPLAVFNGCNFGEAVNNQTIIFDTTFCGQYAGQDAVWKSDAICSQKAPTCQDYVANNPADFADAYWEVNYVKVYQQQDNGYIGQSPIPVPAPSSTTIIATFVPPQPTILSSTESVSTLLSVPLPTMPSLSTLSTVTVPDPRISSRPPRHKSTALVTIDMTTTMTLNDVSTQAQTATANQYLPNPSSRISAQESATGYNGHAAEGYISKQQKSKPRSVHAADCSENAIEGCISGQPGQQAKRDRAKRRSQLFSR